MSTSTLSDWQTAFAVLRDAAMQGRGFVALDDEIDAHPYPRTTGADVVAIAAMLDPSVRAEPLGRVGAHAHEQWLVALADLARDGLASVVREYVHNRAFWQTLADVCIELDADGAPLPPGTLWDALVEQLAAPLDLRNVGPKDAAPFAQLDRVKTFEDLYLAQHKHLSELRGSDRLEPPPGGTGGTRIIPRTTNNDVLQLADYWSTQLKKVRRVFGHDAVEQRWNHAVGHVHFLARSGSPSAVYANNNVFWRALQNTAFHIAAAVELPSDAALFIDAIGDSLSRLPDRIKAGAVAVADGAGKVVNKAATSLFSGLGLPLLIGGGALIGLVALSRGDRKEA